MQVGDTVQVRTNRRRALIVGELSHERFQVEFLPDRPATRSTATPSKTSTSAAFTPPATSNRSTEACDVTGGSEHGGDWAAGGVLRRGRADEDRGAAGSRARSRRRP